MAIVNLALSSFSTTGTISGGALSTLNVVDASGFAINDYIIVEVGGEAGAGARGTGGVGGSWPNLSYPNKATMDADTSQPEGKYAYLVDTGDVYRWFNAVGYYWTPQFGSDTINRGVGYYVQKRVPRGLATRITGKSGTTLTISPAATIATTNANVYFDNAAIIQAVVGYESGVADNSEIIIPTGTFAMSIQAGLYNHHDWVVHGTSKTATTLLFPEGISGGNFFGGDGNNNLTLRDFGMLGNCRSQGYMVYFLPGNETVVYYNEGLRFSNSPNMLVQDIKGVDCQKVFSFETGCHGSIARRIEAIFTEGSWVEVWPLSGNNCNNIQFIDVSVTAPTWTPGPEHFACNDCSMIGVTLHNAFLPMNSDNRFLLQDIDITINGADQGPNSIFTADAPIIDINSNINPEATTGGGTLRNIAITQNGTLPPNNDTLIGISINPKNVNINVIDATVTLPDYVSGSTKHGAIGLNADADNLSVTLFTCHGTTNPPAGSPGGYGNLNLYRTNNTYRCIDVDSVNGGTELPCRSFALHCV